MRSSRRFWRSLETGGLTGLRADWEQSLGEDVAAVAPFLRRTDERASSYPCPFPQAGGCPRGLCERADGRVEAFCRSETTTRCETLLVTKAQTFVEELDAVRLVAHVARLLGFRGDDTAEVEGLGKAYLLGVDRATGREVAVYVALVDGRGRLTATVERLLARDTRPLVVVTGDAVLPLPSAEFLRARGGRALRLVDLTHIDDAGALIAAPDARAALAPRADDGASTVHDVGLDAEPTYCRLLTNTGPAALTRSQYDALLREAEARFAFFVDGVAGTALRRDPRGRIQRGVLRPKEVAILRDVIEARRPLRPKATKAGASCASDRAALKLFTDARAKVDVRLGAKRYRAFRLHQVPSDPTQNAYEFAPPPDLAYGVVVPP